MPKSVTRLLCMLLVHVSLIHVAVIAQNLDDRYPGNLNPITGPSDTDSLAEAFSIATPDLQAPIALLVELETGAVLYAENADRAYPPASLTKIMTIYTALEIYENLGISMDDPAEFSPSAWWFNAPPQSSLMFLGPDQRVSIGELILGLLVSSGNDAAMAIAETSAGSMEGFILRMNQNAAQMGLTDSYFVGPSGYSAQNRASAYDLARLTQRYIARWPWVIEEFHKVRSFTYPREENLLSDDDRSTINITQYNRNGLLDDYPGATGMKTGFIDESGYNLLASARREGMHLLAVILGIQGSSSAEGSRLREADAAALLDWGFDNFSLVDVPLDALELEVSRGSEEVLTLPAESARLLVAGDGRNLSLTSRHPAGILAPVNRDQVVENLVWSQDGVTLGELNRRAPEDIPASRGLQYLWDSIVLFFRRLFGGYSPLEGGLAG
jgi:D-alanyl-D-alanine carboxypeptidase (penicillin-binding protein 5/6)